MKIDYLDGRGLKRAVIAGARRVILMQENLNKINVFPVPDNDTGTNMALTLQSVAEGAISCRDRSLSGMSQCLADSALMGARGNSGAILAQFFQGLADRFKDTRRATLTQFGEAVVQARDSSYEAISEPREGTILTVIHDWAAAIRSRCTQTTDLIDLLKEGLAEANESLKRTPEKLKLLASAGVVDAGAQGFVHMLEGINHFIHSGRIEKAVGIGGRKTRRARVKNAPEDISFRYCTECFLNGENIDRGKLRSALKPLGNSLIVAGSDRMVRVHIHTNEPRVVFDLVAKHGAVSRQKIDDMRKQHAKAYGNGETARIALVTDSSCDLPPEVVIRHNVQMVPVQLTFGQESYIDKITITPKEFYRLLQTTQLYPKTSQPAPADFLSAYQETVRRYEHVVAVHLSGALSGTLQAAELAARSLQEQKLRVINSRNVSVGLGLIVAEGIDAIESGASANEVVERIEWAVANVRFYVFFDTMEYLIRGGRLGKVKGLLAEKLKLKPILTIDREGAAVSISRTVGSASALNKIMELVARAAVGKKKLRFAVAHANAPDRAKWLCKQIRNHFEVRDAMVVDVSPALGAHAGPGAAGVAFLGE